jgi:hypothetical protein
VVASASSTVLSGYVDTSMQWNIGDGRVAPGSPVGTAANSHAPAYKYGGAAKSDGFNLDAILLTLEKPLDESEWSAGYKVDLFMGPDANVLGTSSTGVNNDFAIKQAYVILNCPVGNGLDFKVGVFDSIVGYESTEADKNPNFTRSWGHTFEPSTHTGVLATYRINNSIALSAGIADTLTPTINARATEPNASTSESYKTYMAAIALTAPDDWGFLAGSTFDTGIVAGQQNRAFGAPGRSPQENYYAGVTLNTPVTGLRFGFSWDYLQSATPGANALGNTGGIGSGGAHSFAAYTSYKATEKLSFHSRIEYADVSAGLAAQAQIANVGIPVSVFSATSTVQYDLWKNVLSRLEVRWDHDLSGVGSFGGSVPVFFHGGYVQSGTAVNSFIVAANIIYKF